MESGSSCLTGHLLDTANTDRSISYSATSLQKIAGIHCKYLLFTVYLGAPLMFIKFKRKSGNISFLRLRANFCFLLFHDL